MKLLSLLPIFAVLPFAPPQGAAPESPSEPPAIRPAGEPRQEAAGAEQEQVEPTAEPRGGAKLTPRSAAPRPFAGAPVHGGGFLGVRLQSQGAATTVAEVLPNTPAAAAGLAVGDRLVTVGGRPVDGADGVVRDLGRRAAGERVQLEVLRDGQLIELEAELGARPADGVQGRPEPAPLGTLAPRAFGPGDGAPDAAAPDGGFRIFGLDPRGHFAWPGGSGLDRDDPDVERWLADQEQRTQALREQLERQFFDLRRDFDRDFGDLRRDLERGLGRGGAWLERRFGDGGPLSDHDIPAEAWADLEQRLAPLEQQRQRIAREWAEAHGHPDWADAVPPFGVEVKIERREQTFGR